MSTLVEYILNLSGNLSDKINEATAHTKQLESSVGGVKNALGMLSIAFGAFEIASFIKGGIEKFHEFHEAEAQLQNTMQNMGVYSNENYEKMIGNAKELHQTIGMGTAKIISMQAQFSLIGSIGAEEMQKMVVAGADLAAKFGGEASEWGTALAKGINDPLMARRIEAKVLIDPAIKAHIKELADAGDLAGARLALMAAVESKVGGAAKAAFDANPVAKFNLIMGDAQKAVGEYATDILKKLMPAMEWFAGALKSTITWIKEHQKTLSLVATVIGAVGTVVLGIISATKLWAAAQWLLNIAMTANPLQLVIAGVSALVGGIFWAWNNFEGFRKTVLAVWEVIKAFGVTIYEVFGGIARIYKGIFTFNLSEMKAGLSQVVSAVADAGKNIGEAWVKGQSEGAKSWAGDNKASLIPGKDGKKGTMGLQGEPVAAPKTKAEGQKTINIHVAYNAPLIQGFTISTNNIHEGLGSLKEKISAILVGATHDALNVADH